MNKNKLKVYAPQAREEFIKVVSERAAFYGITPKKIEPCEIKGDYAFISGKPFPKSIKEIRDDLVKNLESKGFTQVMEEAAYTWFNRFAAIRFMELNGYLSHGYRVLSHTQGQSEPEILEKAQYLERLDGLEKKEIIALKTAGNKDAELYRKLIIAQCNELHSAMPFLFERVDDPTELLLPDNLLNTDSVIRQMVDEIHEEDWKQVEVIGWLYQFYISEKKDTLMKAKKAYKTEDIPAVTQLFTPNWIVKYLVQNSLGAKWLSTYPASNIKDKMEYYIEPAEQTDDVKQQLKEITPDSLNPEELTVMDPACGSGHILVEAYNLFKDIYLERGHRPKDIPALILTKNLYGLEIDDRAAQLAGFALMMKARQDDRQIFEKQIKPNILVLKSASGRVQGRKESEDISQLIDLFENSTTFGSLIRIPEELILKLPSIKHELEHKRSDLSAHDFFTGSQYYEDLLDLVKQAEWLTSRYDCVVANPPYIGDGKMNSQLKVYSNKEYSESKADLFSMFIVRALEMTKINSFAGFVSPFVWMFLGSYNKFRELLHQRTAITSLVQIEYNAFEPACIPVAAYTFSNVPLSGHIGSYIRLSEFRGVDKQPIKTLEAIQNRNCGWFFEKSKTEFNKIPGAPIAYWASEKVFNLFINNLPLGEKTEIKQGLATTDNDQFIRFWWEIPFVNIGFNVESKNESLRLEKRWFPYNKGGDFRKWFGNVNTVVDWENDGIKIKNNILEKYPYLKTPDFVAKNQKYYFKECITWSRISSSFFGVRYLNEGYIFDANGSALFMKKQDINTTLMYLCSKIASYLMSLLSPTLSFQAGDVAKLPFLKLEESEGQVKYLVSTARTDWAKQETFWEFTANDLARNDCSCSDVSKTYAEWRQNCAEITKQTKKHEEENNRLFIEAYGLQTELTPDVPIKEITLFANPKYRYKGVLTDEELEARFKADTMKELISYSIGCMMGRYSLDKLGLIYANSGNVGFDATQYKTFPADDDGIVPITDHEWFDDDAACRFFRFIETAWDKKGLDANLDFITEAIGRKGSESSRETIRRYFVNDFYKDHCHTYKKRPIYWLFTSGKEKAFQALVYLHRYNEGTLSRMRTEYVLPLQTKINRHIEHLEKDKDRASSTSAANKIQKEITSLLKQKEELIKFDERLRHYADMKIKLDLDDGVKVNYVKFEDLLAKI